ncbi:MAG: hypothetical protein ACR2JW_00400 [Thermomicrobiales bacterium]
MGNDRKRLRGWVLAQEPRFSKGDVFGPALWRLTGGTVGGRTTLTALAEATGYAVQDTRTLVLLYTLEGYLVGHDDEIEVTERGVVWLITGG